MLDINPTREGNTWVWPDGKRLPVVSGGDETATPGATGTPPPPPPPPAPTHPQLAGLTPEQLTGLESMNRWMQGIAAREKNEGRQAALKEIVEKFDVPPDKIDDVAAAYKKIREDEQAALTEAQRLMQEASTKEATISETERAAHQIILDGLRTDALMDLGMTRAQAKNALDLVKVEGEVTLDTVVAAATKVKDTFPQLFESNGTETTTPTGQATRRPPVDSQTRGTGTQTGGGAPSDAKARAKERLLQNHPELASNS